MSTHAAAARAIRNELKAHGISGSVRSRTFAGGTSVDVRITEDVLPATLQQIKAFAKQYQYGHFDGMTDCYNYDNDRPDLPQVKYVSVDYHASPELRDEVEKYVAKINGIKEGERWQYENMVMMGTWGDFWTTRKPRVRLAA